MPAPDAVLLLRWLLQGHPVTLPGISMPLEVARRRTAPPSSASG